MPQVTRGGVMAGILGGAVVLVGLVVALSQGAFTGETGATGQTGAAGPQGVQGVAGKDPTVACTTCHDSKGTVNSKMFQWQVSGHGLAEAWPTEGGRDNCTACHSGTGFEAWAAAGFGATSAITGSPSNTPIDCRSCHNIHTTYTVADFGLTTTAPVKMIIDTTKVYNAGSSNLCANCHQSRSGVGTTLTITNRYGPHHGPQADMMLGIGGYGVTGDTVSSHYTQVTKGCVTCHMTADALFEDDAGTGGGGHTFTPTIKGCQSCHAGLTTFDRRGVQTDTQKLMDQLQAKLIKAGAMTSSGSVVAGTYSQAIVGALYNYLFVLEDGSRGVHNSFYTEQLLLKSIGDLP